jgi:polyisoprenoid-binding protein YceI
MKHFIKLIILTTLFHTPILSAILSVDTTQQNEVSFLANSTFGNIEGITEKISGHVKWEDHDTMATSKVHFEVLLDSIDTGVGLRNSHMREKYLETEKYPKAIFNGKLVGWIIDKADSSRFLVSTDGTMSIHGVERPLSFSGYLTEIEDGYHAQYFFSLNIKDFDIDKPRFLLVSMDETVRLKLDFYLIRD